MAERGWGGRDGTELENSFMNVVGINFSLQQSSVKEIFLVIQLNFYFGLQLARVETKFTHVMFLPIHTLHTSLRTSGFT